MYLFTKKLFLSLWVCFIVNCSWAQVPKLTDQAKVSILTCGTSTELHSLFGHTGIRIQDPQLGVDLVYNYGAFDFGVPNFYGKFIKGDLLYFIGLDDFASFLFNYQADGRSVWEQVLNISQSQKQNLFKDLAESFGTEKALYTYKFIDKNCTTLAADLITKHTGVKLDPQLVESANQSNRSLLNSYLQNTYFPAFGINLAFGAKTDQRIDHVFLPKQLLEVVEKTTIQNQPLAQPTVQLYEAPEIKINQLPVVLALIGFFLIVGLLCMYRKVAVLFFIFLGLFGLVLFGLQFYSNHSEVHLNYNLLAINPIYFMAAYYTLVQADKKLKRVLQLLLLCTIVYTVIVLLQGYLYFVFPILLGVFIALLITYKLHLKKSA